MTEPYTPTTELMWEAYEYWAAGCGGSNRAEYERFLDAVRPRPGATAFWAFRMPPRKEPTMTEPITIYGASDDLVEVEGAIREEYTLGDPCTRLRATAPDGDSLDIVLRFDGQVGSLDWSIGVEAVNAYPSWPIRFHERPGYEGDPAVTIDAPAGTTVQQVSR